MNTGVIRSKKDMMYSKGCHSSAKYPVEIVSKGKLSTHRNLRLGRGAGMSENDNLITMSYEGGMQFIAENGTGCKIPVEPPAFMGGSGRVPNPVDYLVTALGGCTGIKMIMDISGKGFKLDSFSMKIDGTKSKMPSKVFEKLHLIITLSGDVDDFIVAEIIEDAVMHTCPVAAMFRETAEITWEHHIIK